ncbi:MAG: MFS transporter [Sporichthyaceae bacterium]
MARTAAGQTTGMDRRLVVLLAVACGASAANMYYAQPLLEEIAADLDVSPGAAGLLVTAGQIGFALGLLTLVPLGDLISRHRLIGPLLIGCALASLGAAAAPNLPALAGAVLLIGITAVVVQVLVPFAGSLAADHERGAVVGTVIGGLLTGVLLARVASGLLGAAAGWRAVFVAAAVLCAVLAVVLHTALPRRPVVASELTYGALLRSLGPLLRTDPVLRRRMVYGALGMVAFTLIWTSLSFLIASAAYGYSEAVTGLLSLTAIVGAGAALGGGRLADRGWAHRSTGAFLAVMVAGWVLLWLGGTHLSALIVGLVVLDLGVQGQNVISQSLILSQDPQAGSRMTTLYMTGIFTVGAASSALAAFAWTHGGWDAICALGLGFALLGLAIWVQEHSASRREGKRSELGVGGVGGEAPTRARKSRSELREISGSRIP